MYAGGLEGHVAIHLGIKQPEGNINAFDFLNVVFRIEGLWQQGLVPVVLLQRGYSRLLVHLEGNNQLRLLVTGKLAGNDAGVAAVGAGGGSGGLVAHQLCAAGGAVVDVEGVLVLAPLFSGGLHVPCRFMDGLFGLPFF